MNIVLIGMKHCGKSTLGQMLAERWGCEFHDVDPLIEALHECETGAKRTVREIFADCGEAEFRRLESLVVCELYMNLERSSPDCHTVVALGGRTVMNRRVVELLDGIGTLVYLRADPTLVLARILAGGVPPFLEGDETGEQFMQLWARRVPEYERLAEVTIEMAEKTPDQAVEELLRKVERHAKADREEKAT